ncbi:MAG: hypothetical protein WCA45_11860 [Thiobacillaceae bacterium]
MLAPFSDQGFLILQRAADKFARLPRNMVRDKGMTKTVLGNLDNAFALGVYKVCCGSLVKSAPTRWPFTEWYDGESGANSWPTQFSDQLPFDGVITGKRWVIEAKADADHEREKPIFQQNFLFDKSGTIISRA